MTEDRRKLGLAMPLSIAANVTLPVPSPVPLAARPSSSVPGEEEAAEGFRQRLDIKAPSAMHLVEKLSGGNQQKVMFGKWLNTRPKIFLLDEPTRGIDVGAKAEVHAMVRELAEEGMAILCISSDLPEVLAMSDRILVMREGRQMGILGRDEATQRRVMSSPSRTTVPSRSVTMPKIAFMAVDLPAPLGPTMTATSPCRASTVQPRMMSAPP